MNAQPARVAATLASAATLVLMAAPARADQPPAFRAGPVLAGPASVGAPMRVVARWSGLPAPAARYEWSRCDAAGFACEVVDGACSESYVPTFDDFGQRLTARVDLLNSAGAVSARTPLSDLILGVPALPAADAEPASACGAVATPVGQPAPAPAAAPAPPTVGPPVRGGLAYMRPFPIVRIRGFYAAGGVRVTLLSVRGPRSARVRATCAGDGCPPAPQPAVAPPARLRAFERFLPAGTVLRVRITAASAIGKYASFRIRAHRAPRRMDRCLLPGRWAPVRCPVL